MLHDPDKHKPYSNPILDFALSSRVHDDLDDRSQGFRLLQELMDDQKLSETSGDLKRLLESMVRQEEKTLSQNDQPAFVNDVSVVGALFDKKHNLYGKDKIIITNALRILKEAEIPLARNLRFHFYNLLPPLSSDFLRASILNKSAPQSDVVITCGLWGRKTGSHDIDSLHPLQRRPLEDFSYDQIEGDFERGFRERRMTTVSRLQAAPETWAMASDNVGAKFVITEGDDNDLDYVNTNHFLFDDFYNAVVPTSKKFQRSQNGHYGILVRNEDIAEIKRNTCARSPLGQRIYNLG